MPGISGIITKTQHQNTERRIGTMVNCMMHEPFYSSGIYSNDKEGIYAGWVCHKDSFCDCMPVWNEKKNMAMIFFGENYTDLDLFDQLKAKNHRFDKTNASYLIHMYEENGIEFLQNLNGWFSGLIIDLQASKLILFNDRFGMQKIFYYESRDAFYFSSEAKALLNVCPELKILDAQGLGELVSCGSVLENRTLFDNVNLLPPASAWIFSGSHEPNKDRYFEPSAWEDQAWLECEYFYDKFRETFVRILPRYFRGNQQIAMSLTGGLDTRMLMSNAVIPAGKYPCYTFASMYRDCNDVKVARRVAEATGQSHQTIPVDQAFLRHFADHAEKTVYLTDGYLDVGGSPEIFVNRIAREIGPVRMTGNFGSEVLRNIRWLRAGKVNESIFSPDFNEHIRATSETLNGTNKTVTNPLTFTLFVETPWWGNNRLVSEQSQLTLRAPYLDNDLIALMYRAPMGARDSKNISLRLIADGNPALRAIPTDRGYGGSLKFPLSNAVRLYHEFLFKAEYAYNYGMPQWLARLDYTFKFMHFERLFLGRHKFYHFRLWYRDELAGYVKDILLDNRTLTRPYLNRKAVEYVVESHTKGYRNHTIEITQLLTLELIQRQLIEQK
jgi:asparagine synthase (glutamine-hydrolysing)